MSNDITFKPKSIILADEAATLAFAAQFASTIKAGLVVYLHGDLGAGKTTFVRGVLQALGHIGKVKSPTYTLVELYHVANFNIYHFDLYRFIDEEEWDAAGFREYFNAKNICMVEWPEKASNILPQADIDIKLTPLKAGRELQLLAHTVLGELCLNQL
jgi:tRNA threonylcarbamoyladenosine biosynthesis protein TsaE